MSDAVSGLFEEKEEGEEVDEQPEQGREANLISYELGKTNFLNSKSLISYLVQFRFYKMIIKMRLNLSLKNLGRRDESNENK